jgi:integrase
MKALLSAIFKHAKRQGVLDCINPMQDVSIPKGKETKDTYAYSLEEELAMLNVLSEPANTATAIAAFTGLGQGELKGLRWEDYNGETIEVRRSVWEGSNGTGKTFHITDPKTQKRKAPVPVIPLLKQVLDSYRTIQDNPQSGWLFPSPSGERPIHLSNLVNRVIKPALKDAGLQWHGWHAFRRGLGTNLYGLGVDDKTVQAVLRHSNVSTTMTYYVKPLPKQTLNAMQKLQQEITSRIQ